jgi:hypothetical protein
MPSCQRADARWLSSHPRMRAGGRTVATHRTTPGTVLPAARQRGWEDRRRAAARRQEGMGSSGDLRTPTVPRHNRRPRTRRQVSPRAWSHPCPPASALTRAGCPPIRAYARTGGRSRTAPSTRHVFALGPRRATLHNVPTAPKGTVLLAARKRGWEDRRRAQARRQEGMGNSGDPRTPTVPRHNRRPRTRRQVSPRAWSHPCPPASALTRAGCPPIRAYARTGGRSRTAPSTRHVFALGPRRAALHNVPTAPKGTVLLAARKRGWEDRRRAQARRQDGMGGSGDPRTPTIPRHNRRPRTRRQAPKTRARPACGDGRSC